MLKHTVKIAVLVAGLTLLIASPLIGEPESDERILDFHSDIVINEDSTIIVTETIKVLCGLDEIMSGIYRDLPQVFEDQSGRRKNVSYRIIYVMRDGEAEVFRNQKIENKRRIRIGQEEVSLEKGRIYTYTIKYKVRNQLGYFDDHDELCWILVGSEWNIPIDKATAVVHFPESVPLSDISISQFSKSPSRYSNRFPFDENTTRTVKNKDSKSPPVITISDPEPATTYAFSIVFPKGHVRGPAPLRQLIDYVRRNSTAIIITIIVIIILLNFGSRRNWYRSGFSSDYYYHDYGGYHDYGADFFDISGDSGFGTGGGGGW